MRGGVDLGPWDPLPVETLPSVLGDLDCWWCVAGGVGLELFAGRVLRAHDDIDIEIPRSQQTAIVRVLPDWEHFAAHAGGLTRWHGDRNLDAENSIWSRPDAAAPWALQTMFATIDADDWVYRRAPGVRVPFVPRNRPDRRRHPVPRARARAALQSGETEIEGRGRLRRGAPAPRRPREGPARARALGRAPRPPLDRATHLSGKYPGVSRCGVSR